MAALEQKRQMKTISSQIRQIMELGPQARSYTLSDTSGLTKVSREEETRQLQVPLSLCCKAKDGKRGYCTRAPQADQHVPAQLPLIYSGGAQGDHGCGRRTAAWPRPLARYCQQSLCDRHE